MLGLLRAKSSHVAESPDPDPGTKLYSSYWRPLNILMEQLTLYGLPLRAVPRPVTVSTSEDTALVQMIRSLFEAASASFPTDIFQTTLSTPVSITAIQWRDHFHKAAQQAGLTLVTNVQTPLNAMEAAAAANGLGMCTNYTNLPTCYYELDQAPLKRTLAIEYTNETLSGRFTDSTFP